MTKEATQSNALVIVGTINAVSIFDSPEKADDIIGHLRVMVDEFKKTADISTEDGRKEIASFAYKIARSKTAVDELGKSLNAERLELNKAVNAERNRLEKEIQSLQDEARKPLTDWENLEEERKQSRIDLCKKIEDITMFAGAPELEMVKERIDFVSAFNPLEVKDEFTARLESAKNKAVSDLDDIYLRRKKEIDDAAEFERLKKEEAERAEKARIQAIADAAADKAKKDAEEKAAKELAEANAKAEAERNRIAAEAKKQSDEAAEREQKLKDEKVAFELNLEKERQAAKEAAEKAEMEKQRALKKAAADAEAAVEAERNRVAMETAEKAAADEKRNQDIEHKKTINNAAYAVILEVIYAVQADELTADEATKKLITMIAKNEVPHVSIKY